MGTRHRDLRGERRLRDHGSAATAVYGQTLYGTSAAVAAMFFPLAPIFGVASAASFSNALCGGLFMASGGRMGPVLLVDPGAGDPVPAPIASYLHGLAEGTSIYVFGGPLAIPEPVVTAVQSDVG